VKDISYSLCYDLVSPFSIRSHNVRSLQIIMLSIGMEWSLCKSLDCVVTDHLKFNFISLTFMERMFDQIFRIMFLKYS